MKISVITVVLNRANVLPTALESLRQQQGVDYEHIVQDGGSTDGTVELLAREAQADPRLRFVSERDGGIYDGLNHALARVNGDIIGLLHSDDYFAHGGVLARVADRFDATGADAVYGDLDYVSATAPARVIRHWRAQEFRPERLRRGWMPPHPALFFRGRLIDELGTFDTSYQIAADYDFILRYFGQKNFKAVHIPEVLVKMRVGGLSNGSLRQILRKSYEDYRALRNNRVGGLVTLALKNLSKLGQFVQKN